jgi:hypothetical protein
MNSTVDLELDRIISLSQAIEDFLSLPLKL